MKKINAFGLVLGIAFVHAALAEELPRALSVPGGVALVPLASAAKPMPEVTYKGKRIMVKENEGRWYAVVGISLDAVPGEQVLNVKEGNASEERTFAVAPKEYTTQKITLKNERMVTPDKKDIPRIMREIARARAVFDAWRATPDVRFPLTFPLEGPFHGGRFGLRRVFNGEPRRPHSGLDIPAPTGTEVHAPASGRVEEAGEFYFNGNTLFIDHGQGLVTMYAHLSEIDVKPGQEVKRGQLIGKVGSTGRATGPHLHWTVTLNGTAVDPELFVSTPRDSLADATSTH